MLNIIKPPKNISVDNFFIQGFNNDKILIKEISPESPKDFALLVLHGGGFGYKTAPHQLTNAFEYTSKLNCKTYLVDYHLLPKFPFPAAYEDSLKTYEYLISNADKLKINPKKIIVLGDSAGGCLAANLCNTVESKNLPPPCCQVLIYPVTDNSMTTNSMKTFTDTPLWNSKNNQRMWKMYLKDCTPQQEQIAVPMKNPLPKVLPPTYIETAEFDCLHDEGIIYAEKIKNRTAELQINETKGTFHGYDMLSSHPISKDSVEKRIAFMKKWMD
ncbi:MAG: alpha/beta hydrolase [Spirochaetaceae bacterium]|nr:alpha/beta hydrolase [Spirochaetaceae bacterium]